MQTPGKQGTDPHQEVPLEASTGARRSSVCLGIVRTDAGGCVVYANPAGAALFGAPSCEALRKQSITALAGEFGPDLEALIRDAVASGCESSVECAGTSCHGAAMHCRVTVSPLKEEAAAPTGLLFLFEDLRDEAVLRERGREVERLSALGKILSGVAHELNNPLTGILGYAQMLQSTVDDPKVQARLERITEEAVRCSHIVKNLLSFARRHKYKKSAQNLNTCLREVLALVEYQLHVDGVSLATDLEADLPSIPVDGRAIQTAFLNIINNAHQALTNVEGRDRVLRIESARDGDQVVVRFSDNGPGIDADDLSRIFDPFFSTRSFGDGTGLGLSVCYGVIKEHGGHIEVASRPGEGTTFTITLPVLPS